MTRREKPTPASTKPEGKNANLKYLLIGTVALVIIAIAFIIMRSPEPVQPNVPPVPHPTPTTSFRDDGVLIFSSADGRQKARITIEIAQTEEQRTQGLMGRTGFDFTKGMLFIFDNEEERAFWMANTPTSLDIIFVNRNKEIVKIHSRTQPYSTDSYPSEKPAKYVVETLGGFCSRFGIEEGDRISWLAE
ncbi:MAG: DUF192 domain-containing protein [Chlorobi bacterium]|nr:DUF192 domain-containing protein [Chlorobiota bacterium]